MSSILKPLNIKIIYVAGAYRPKNINNTYEVYHNIHKARVLAEQLVVLGYMPLTPHLNTGFFDGLNDESFFIEGTKELMRRCNGVLIQTDNYRLSTGTMGEIKEAERLGMPIFYNIESLDNYFQSKTHKLY